MCEVKSRTVHRNNIDHHSLNKVSCYRNNVDIQFQIPVLLSSCHRYSVVRCPCCTVTQLEYWPELAAPSFLLSFCLTLYYCFMKLTGATSSILFCRCNSRIPFSVVLYVWPTSYSIRSFSTRSVKYSLSWLKERYAFRFGSSSSVCCI